jgi:glycosyltransferase involved in cell wall biosynthesis
MARLTDRFPTAELLVIGRGSARPGLEKLAGELGLGDRTRFTGFLSNEERDSLLTKCRLCVCASEKEGWGLTVIEANQLGTPVVASDVPGLRDSVRDGRTGLLAPYGDVEAFAEGIGRLLGEDALSLDMSREALRWSHRFDWEVAASEMAEAIDRARRAA